MKDADIIDGLKRGDTKTLNYLTKEYYGWTISHVMWNRGSYEDGKEHFYICLFEVWKNNKSEKNQPREEGEFKKIFRTVIRNRWIDELRRRKTTFKGIGVEAVEPNEFPFNDDSETAQKNKEVKAYLYALSQLNPLDSELVTLKYKDGLNYAAISKTLSNRIPPIIIKENNISQRIFEAIKKLKKICKIELKKLDNLDNDFI